MYFKGQGNQVNPKIEIKIMAMNRTEGYYKTFIEVSYLNNKGAVQHIASFQIYTDTDLNRCYDKKEEFVSEGETVLAPSVQAYLAALRSNEYQLIITCHVMA